MAGTGEERKAVGLMMSATAEMVGGELESSSIAFGGRAGR